MYVAALDPGVTVDLVEPMQSWCKAMCSCKTARGVFRICVEREETRFVDLVHGSRVFSEVLNTEQMGSDLALARVEELDPAEKLREFATVAS